MWNVCTANNDFVHLANWCHFWVLEGRTGLFVTLSDHAKEIKFGDMAERWLGNAWHASERGVTAL